LKLDFIGDALDHWKGSLFSSLQRAALLRDFRVDPMASDGERWQPRDWKILGNLLTIEPDQIVEHEENLQNRAAYFSEIPRKCDLFLDPDTGIATGHVKQMVKYVRPEEIGGLLEGSAERLLIVYQHAARRQRLADRVDRVWTALTDKVTGLRCCTYESGSVAMFFLARDSARLKRVAKHFRKFLGRHAKRRIRTWNV